MRIINLSIILLFSACTSLSNRAIHKSPLFSVKALSIKLGEALVSTFEILPEYINKGLAISNELHCDNKKKYQGHRRSKTKAQFYIPVSYFSTTKLIKCSIIIDGESHEVATIKVINKEYPSERLFVDRKRVVLSLRDQARASKEQLMLNKIYANSNIKPLFSKHFKAPLHSKVTSVYGTRRVFNNEKKTQHLGTDFRARVGKAVQSTNRGRVVFSGDLFYTGGTIIVDHGLGIYSVYGHLSKRLFKVNDIVERGEVIALAGKSGRVTGPHLHWGVKIHGEYIDGLEFVDMSKTHELSEIAP